MVFKKAISTVTIALGCAACAPAMVDQGDAERAKTEAAKPAVATVLGVR